MLYSMKQTCEQTGLTYDTLKFYCNEGLIPNVKRDKNNYRVFNDKDIAWIKSLSCLKNCGMSIIEMKEYLKLCLEGESSIPERQKILDIKLKELNNKISEIQESINYIHWKQNFYKDVLERNKLKNIDLLKRVYAFLCGNVGSITSTNSIAKYITKEAKLDTSLRPATIGNILEMLENAFIIYKANRYDVRGKEVLKSLETYYLADTGLKNTIVGYNLENYGHSIENVVYLELLRRGYQVYVGKNNDKEIDFVAVNKEEIRYFQVTETFANKTTWEREIAPFYTTNDFYEKTIITADKTFITNTNGIKIVNIIDFLLS